MVSNVYMIMFLSKANIPGEPVDVVPVLVQPRPIESGNNSSDSKEIAVMEVMVVVVPIAEVNVHICCAGLADDASPSCLICRQCG